MRFSGKYSEAEQDKERKKNKKANQDNHWLGSDVWVIQVVVMTYKI